MTSSFLGSNTFSFPSAWGQDLTSLQDFFKGAGFSSFASTDMAWLQADLSKLGSQGLLGSSDVTLLQQFLQSGKLPQGEGARQSLQQMLNTVMVHHQEDSAAPHSGAYVDMGSRNVEYRVPGAMGTGQSTTVP